MSDEKVTIEHIQKAYEWAKRGGGELNGFNRKYDQSRWTDDIEHKKLNHPCTTSHCIWGAAYLLATHEDAGCGPSSEWSSISKVHASLTNVMYDNDEEMVLFLMDLILNKGLIIGRDYAIEYNVQIGNNVRIGNDIEIGNNAVIEHNVQIGNNVRIGDDVWIGDYVRIGDNVWIGDDVRIGHFAQIPNDAHVDHNSVI